MKMRMLGKNRKIIFLLFLLCSFSLQAQIDTRGTDFWLGIMGRTSGGGDVSIRVVSGNQAAMGSIYFTHLGTSVPFFIPANSVFTHDLNSSQKQAIQSVSTGTTDYSVHITSSTLVTVYCLSAAGNAACDATNVLPVTALGTDYYQMNYTQASPSNYTSDYLVVAVQNNTQVFHNGSLAATLGTGGVYYRKNTSDNTGTHITTSKPAAFIAATGGAYIPLGSAAIDNMLQQLAPVNTWGKNFFIPVTVRKRERIRVVASQNGTNITQTGGVIQSVAGGQTSLNNLNAGQWVELEISLANNGCYLQANKPVGVCSYLTGGTYNRPLTNNDDSDPAQAWVPSIEQSVDTALIAPFMPNGATNLSAHYAMVITPTATKNLTRVSVGGATSVALNGGQWYDNATAGMSFYMMPLSNNPAISYMFTNATGGLIVMGYGIGNAVSYYYLASAGMRSLDIAFYVKNIYYQNINSPFICANSLPFRAEINGDRSPHAGYLKWYIDGVEEVNARDSITWNKTLPNGTYQIRMTVLAFDNITVDTVETTISIQSADTAALYDTVCQHFAYSNHGFTISANQLQTAGNFEFRDTVLSTEGCDSVIVLHLKVNQLDTTMLYDTICLNNAYSNYGFAISANQLQTAGNFEFRDTVLNTNGCDSLIILYLKVNRLDTTMLYDTICLNNAYSNYGFSIPANQLITAGNFEFRDTTLNIGGCDSLVILYLTVNQYDTTVLYDTVCLHHAYSNHGFDISANQLPTVGDFEFRDTVQNIVGCDSLIILHLTVKHADIAIFYDTTCLHHAYSNYGFDIPANQLITAGNLEFRDTVQNMAGCDSTIVLYLTVNQIDTTIFYDTICLNNPYSNYGFTIPANQLQTAGNFEFRDTVLNTGGCDSIIVLYLTVNQIDTTTFYDTICLNNPYSNYGFDIPANQLQTAGNFEFRDTILNTDGCDSIIVLYLTVNQSDIAIFYDTICPNNTYAKHGFYIPANELQTEGTFEFRDTISTTTFCDNFTILNLTVTYSYSITMPDNKYFCAGETCPAIDFSGTNIDALEWEITSNSGEAIGLFAENGTGTIPAFTTVNYSDTAVTVEITVTPKSTEGCSGTPQIFTITVYSSNPLHINLGNDTTICWLDSLKLDAKNTEATHYQWQDASTGNTYTVYYDGQYWVKITNLCSGASDTINISYLKAINLDLGSDTVFCENDRIHLEFDVSSPHASYLWQDGSISPVYIAEKAGIYSVTVSNVCMSVSGEMEISLKNCDSLLIWTPNAFTPNGDGLNDVFKPMIYREELLKRFEMFIYDRWGNLIFTTQDYLIGWDGGNYAEGVYSCHIRLTDIEDKVIVRYTSILLTR